MAEPATRRKQQRVEAVGIAANQPIRLRFRASPTSRNGGAVLRTGKGGHLAQDHNEQVEVVHDAQAPVRPPRWWTPLLLALAGAPPGCPSFRQTASEVTIRAPGDRFLGAGCSRFIRRRWRSS